MKVFLFVFSFSVVFLSSCKENRIKYPLDVVLYGPYDQIGYESIKDNISLAPDTMLWNFFYDDDLYVAEISNRSEDTFLVFVSRDLGLLWSHYICFYYSKNKCLMPGGGPDNLVDDFKKLDTLLPNSSKRYFTWLEGIKNNDLISISIDIKSPFFDSINVLNPIRYYWHDMRLFDAKHPAFLFQISENRSLVPATSINIQAGLNRCKEK